MSTRSGKRLHGSPQGSPVECVPLVLQSERKTRNKKQKENIEVVVKKKHNYVSYPADDDTASVSSGTTEEKPKRRTRRNTLKEHNIDVPVTDDIDNNNDNKKNVVKTRRGKKAVIEVECALDEENNENTEDLVAKPATNAKKKNRKKKNHKKTSIEDTEKIDTEPQVVLKKKGGKKKKKSSITEKQEEQNGPRILNMSADSFHSATGSPVHSGETGNDKANVSMNSVEPEGKDDLNATFDKTEATDDVLSSKNDDEKKNASIINVMYNENVNTTFDKSDNEPKCLNTTIEKLPKNKRKSSIKNSTFDKTEDTDDVLSSKNDDENKNASIINVMYSENLNTTFDKSDDVPKGLNTTIEKLPKNKRKSSIKNFTFDKTADTDVLSSKNDEENKNASIINVMYSEYLNTTFDKSDDAPKGLNTTVEKVTKNKRKSSIKNSTFDKTEDICENETKNPNATFDKDDVEPQNSTFEIDSSKIRRSSIKGRKSIDSVKSLNSTFEKTSKSRISVTRNDTIDKDNNSNELNTTFDAEKKDLNKSENDSKKSSLISSDATINITFDKSDDSSHISITSDESKTENILNCTPVLIESSVDESRISEHNKTPENSEVQPPLTPLKREGTFTKDGPDDISTKSNTSAEKTPVKRKSLPSPGRTPFPLSKSAQKEKSMLNVTRSIEKSLRRSSLGDVCPRQTKVMFCSPINNPAVVTQIKGRIIKSNLKGSNKSFVFDDSVSSEVRPAGRKRSHTHNEAETRAKRKRLADDMQHSVDRLSRPRTVSATAKLPDPDTPSKKAPTPSKVKPARTKLPNFAALHQKQFARMESLDECQRRRAQRAKHLLTPTGSVAIIERISPKGTPPQPAPPIKEPVPKPQTPPKSKFPTLASLNPGYTRFGFKLDVDVNPFSVTAKKPEIKKQEEKRPNGLSRQTTCLALPSLAGATATRRDVAKQTVMREKSFTEKRDVKRKENRTIIKGVRTNRRFELQMKLRNINS
ncbi:uncharacterized protein [Epargyreus clarus]|uniref:uncharacterized protein n=1 Tax=Epargyreus clarus TaxID=520877 RepID=UPI003C2DEEE5